MYSVFYPKVTNLRFSGSPCWKMERIGLILISCIILSIGAVKRPRGVSLEKASFYQLDKEFKCLTDGKVFPIAYVNDDYCDCEDGSDEPGTSACHNGLFYCENKSFKGHYLKTSRVNDGICDCCDGSDEFDSTDPCPNTCIQKYKAEKAQQEAFRQHQEEGYKVKQEYMQQGKRAKDEKLSKLSEMEKEKETLASEVAAAEILKSEAEEPEKVAIEEHKKAWELVKEERQKAKDALKASNAFSTLDANSDGSVDYPELMKHKEFDIDSDGTVSEEEAKEYLEESDQVDLSVFTEKIWPNIKEIYKPEQDENVEAVPVEHKDEDYPKIVEDKAIPDDIAEGGSPEDLGVAEDERYNAEDGDEEDEEEDDDDEDSPYDISDHKSDADDSEEEKEPEYSEETKRLIEVANEARNKYDEADRRLKDAEREINDIKQYLETDFGPNEEFAALKDQCFEHTDREYTYRLCPFSKTTQKNKNGGIETSLGVWGKWHGPDDDKYDTMKYENGQGCWNGPSRSTHVNLHCGSTNTLTSASEPSRCEYQFEFTTPARCEMPKPIDLQDTHDEL